VKVETQNRRSKTKGVVYFAFKSDLVKIGFTTRPWLRKRELGPEVMRVITDGSRKLERELHLRFDELCVTGEWFKYEGKLKQFLDGLGSLPDAAPWQRPRNKPRRTKQTSGWMRRTVESK